MRAFAIDIETDGLSFLKNTIIGMGYWGPEEEGFLTSVEDMTAFLERCQREDIKLMMHNGKFDQKFLYKATGVWPDLWMDTMLAASLLAEKPSSLKLDVLAAFHLALPLYKDKAKIKNLKDLPIEEVKDYCLLDCRTTYKLGRKLYKQAGLEKQLDFLLDYFCPAANLIAKMEYNGFNIDVPLLKRQWEDMNLSMINLEDSMRTNYKELVNDLETQKFNEKVSELKKTPSEKQIKSYKEKFLFNFRSPSQCLWLLKDKLGLACLDPKSSAQEPKTSTSVDALTRHTSDHPIVNEILSLRRMEKMVDYYRDWDEAASADGRIHANFNLTTTRTGRLSSSNPNLQQVKRGEPRKLFTASEGRELVVMDYAQIEPRVVAELSKDPTLIDGFLSGEDFYSVLIKKVMKIDKSPKEIKATMPEIRAVGKEIGLAILYGTGPYTLASILAKRTGVTYTTQQCTKIIDDYFEGFPKLQEFKYKVEHFANKHGYVQNVFGRHVFVDAGEVYHTSVNSLVQSSASDICLFSQKIVADNTDSSRAKLILAVHDEVVYDVHPSYTDEFCVISKECMEKEILKHIDKSTPWSVPLIVEQKTGATWAIK